MKELQAAFEAGRDDNRRLSIVVLSTLWQQRKFSQRGSFAPGSRLPFGLPYCSWTPTIS